MRTRRQRPFIIRLASLGVARNQCFTELNIISITPGIAVFAFRTGATLRTYGLRVHGGVLLDGFDEPIDIASFDNGTAPFDDRFGTPTGTIGHHRCPAGQRLYVGGGEIIRIGRIDEHRRLRLEADKLLDILGAAEPFDALREAAPCRRIQPHQQYAPFIGNLTA